MTPRARKNPACESHVHSEQGSAKIGGLHVVECHPERVGRRKLRKSRANDKEFWE